MNNQRKTSDKKAKQKDNDKDLSLFRKSTCSADGLSQDVPVMHKTQPPRADHASKLFFLKNR